MIKKTLKDIWFWTYALPFLIAITPLLILLFIVACFEEAYIQFKSKKSRDRR